MATPPTVRSPTWADDGGADVTDPGTSKQATGWVEGEAPAADHTNWLLNAQGEWLDYLVSLAPIRVVGMLAADWEFETGQIMLTSDAGLGSLVTPTGCAFSATGDRLFQNNAADNTIYQYDLSNNWDISSATYSTVNYDASTQVAGYLHSIAWKPDGLAFYVTDATGGGDVYQYTCTTAYSIASGVSYASKTLDTATEMTQPTSIQFASNGETAWITGSSGSAEGDMYEYTLSTAWDIGTASYASKSVDLYDSGAGPYGVSGAFWSADGLRVLAIGHSSGGTAIEYRNWIANSPWNITTLNSLGSKVTDTNWPSVVNGVGPMPDGSRVILNIATDDDARAFRVNHLARGH